MLSLFNDKKKNSKPATELQETYLGLTTLPLPGKHFRKFLHHSVKVSQSLGPVGGPSGSDHQSLTKKKKAGRDHPNPFLYPSFNFFSQFFRFVLIACFSIFLHLSVCCACAGVFICFALWSWSFGRGLAVPWQC